MKNFLPILFLFLAHLSFGQTKPVYTCKLLRIKDAVRLSYAAKSKAFHKAISFRDSSQVKYQTNKRANWIVPAGWGYYGWEGFAHYNSKKDTIELCKAHLQDQVLVSYTSFIDLDGNKTPDIIFSNIYDQLLKTQSNWTDIFFNVHGKYVPIMLKGYLLSFEKKDKNIVLMKTLEPPVYQAGSFCILHYYELDTKRMQAEEISTEKINPAQVRQSE